jgi:hypothetical protein
MQRYQRHLFCPGGHHVHDFKRNEVVIMAKYHDENCLYEDEKEKNLHQSVIRMLTLSIGMSGGEVEKAYEEVLKSFKEVARIKDYLPILVGKRVKEDLLRSMKASNKEAKRFE